MSAPAELRLPQYRRDPVGTHSPLHCHGEISMHVRAEVHNGLTAQEISEVLLHTAVYAGAPAANAAFAVAQRVLAELGEPAAQVDGAG